MSTEENPILDPIEKTKLQTTAKRLRAILKEHEEGKPVFRDMVARIEAREKARTRSHYVGEMIHATMGISPPLAPLHDALHCQCIACIPHAMHDRAQCVHVFGCPDCRPVVE